MSSYHEKKDQPTPQPTLLHLLNGSSFSVQANTHTLALADIGLGAADGTHYDDVVSLPYIPILLTGHDHPELLNRTVVGTSADLFSSQQRVLVQVIDSDKLKSVEHDIVRFLCGPVATAHYYEKDPHNSKQQTWHAVINILLNNPQLEKMIAKYVFKQHGAKSTLANLQLLCAHRAGLSTISTYRKHLESSKAA